MKWLTDKNLYFARRIIFEITKEVIKQKVGINQTKFKLVKI